MDLNQKTFYQETFEDLHDEVFNFSGREITSCCFNACDLSSADFSNANLEDVCFTDCNLSLVNFENAHLQGVSFVNSKIMGVNFTKANPFGLDISFNACVIKNT
nr:pentapeptide repeat-containing protein [Candidatus Cloacimonadota bacterium]